MKLFHVCPKCKHEDIPNINGCDVMGVILLIAIIFDVVIRMLNN